MTYISLRVSLIVIGFAVIGIVNAKEKTQAVDATPCYKRGDLSIKAGVAGFPGTGYYTGLFYGIHDALSAEISAGKNSFGYTVPSEKVEGDVLQTSLKMAVHIQNLPDIKQFFPLRNSIDVYIGGLTGFEWYKEKTDSLNALTSTLEVAGAYYNFYGGIQFYFLKNVSCFVEWNGLNTGIGITISLKQGVL